MPQVLKQDVHDTILAAATVCFARSGFHPTSMAGIAREAGVSAGNIYRYFDDKQALFAAVLPDAFIAELQAVLDRRVASLAALDDLAVLDDLAQRRQSEFLGFLVENRLRVILLLDRCDGTAHEGFAGRFVDGLVRRALASSASEPSPHTHFVLRCVFDGARRTLVDVLEAHHEPTDIAAALASFWTFQIAGLAALMRSRP